MRAIQQVYEVKKKKLVTCIFYNQEVEFKLPTHHIPPAGLDMLGLGESRS